MTDIVAPVLGPLAWIDVVALLWMALTLATRARASRPLTMRPSTRAM
jgi:hypothetical protein